MSLFIDPRTKKRKNPVVLISFLTAVLFLLIYGFFFTVLTDPLYRHELPRPHQRCIGGGSDRPPEAVRLLSRCVCRH